MRRSIFLVCITLAASPASAGQLALRDAAAARKLYVAKCAKCHKFHDPRNYTDREWERWMGKMSRKSNLKADQEAVLRQYLAEYRAGRREKVR